jgi:hypothetical protein
MDRGEDGALVVGLCSGIAIAPRKVATFQEN